ncbi:hypothetical protein AMTRI_Chr03g140410 [Amborella trichopoda]
MSRPGLNRARFMLGLGPLWSILSLPSQTGPITSSNNPIHPLLSLHLPLLFIYITPIYFKPETSISLSLSKNLKPFTFPLKKLKPTTSTLSIVTGFGIWRGKLGFYESGFTSCWVLWI